MKEFENQVDAIFRLLERFFVDKRSSLQSNLIRIIDTTKWEEHERAFATCAIISLVLSFSISKIVGAYQDLLPMLLRLILLAIFLFLLLIGFILSVYLWLFAKIMGDIRTYQTSLQEIDKQIKEEQNKLFNLTQDPLFKSLSLRPDSPVKIVKQYFTSLIIQVESSIQFLDQCSMLFAIFCVLLLFFMLGFPVKILGEIGLYNLGMPTLVVLMNLLLRTMYHFSLRSIIRKHRKCLLILERLES